MSLTIELADVMLDTEKVARSWAGMKTIVRVQHDKNCPYLMVAKETIYDTDLSFAERGFLIALLALPDDWQFNIRGLVTTVRHLSAIFKAGYCNRVKSRSEDGRFECRYTVFERPWFSDRGEKPGTQNGDRTSTQNTCPVNGYILNKELHTTAGAEAPPVEAKKADSLTASSSPAKSEASRENNGLGERKVFRRKRAPRKYAFTFNADSGKFEGITDAQVSEWQQTYTALDIEQELEHMIDWLKANGLKKNYPRFVVGWLIRGQSGARRAG
jgi:hypothetical protein